MSEVKETKGPDPADDGPQVEHQAAARIPRPKREAVRRRLLDAALEVFASYGFERATLDQVADTAGLTKGAIYSNFASKDDLFFAMMNEQALRRADAVRTVLTALPADASGEQTADRIGRLLTEAFTQERDWQLVLLDFWGRAVRSEAVRAQFLANRRTLRAAITERIEQALGRSPNAAGISGDELVTVALALSNGLAIEEYIDPGLVAADLFGRVLARLSR